MKLEKFLELLVLLHQVLLEGVWLGLSSWLRVWDGVSLIEWEFAIEFHVF